MSLDGPRSLRVIERQIPQQEVSTNSVAVNRYGVRWLLPFVVVSLLLIVLTVSVGWLVVRITDAQKNQVGVDNLGVLEEYRSSTLANGIVDSLAGKSDTMADALQGGVSNLMINGKLKVSSSLQLTPMSSSVDSEEGSIYYDAASRQPYYYNGTEYVSLSSRAAVTSLGGVRGNISLGGGLVLQGGTLALLPELLGASQALPQDLAVTAAPTFNGLQLTNKLDILSGGTGATTSDGARANIAAAKSGVNDDIVSLTSLQSIVPVGTLSIGSLSSRLVLQGDASSTWGVTSSGLSTTLLFATPTSNTTLTVPSLPGGAYDICTTSGNCLTGAGVANINGMTGGITVMNATAGSGVLMLNDASTAAKGIAQFNATNFSVASGVVNTIQNIGTSARPVFDGVQLQTSSANPSLRILTSASTTAGIVIDTASGITGNALEILSPAFGGTTSFAINNAGDLTVGGLGVGGGATGTITIVDAFGGHAGTFLPVASGLNADRQYRIPDESGTLCLQGSANCGFATSGANSNITSLSGLTTALSVVQGGTGMAALAQNGVLVGNGTSAISSVTSGAAGQCLMSTAGLPTFAPCPGGGGVLSVNSLTGAVLLSNSSTAGQTVTIDDASTTQKGIAQFNSTNFSVAAGLVNTVQGIATTSTPTFAGLSLTSALTVANGGTGATTAGGARVNIGAAASGANNDITSLSGLTTALSVAQGGTGSATAGGARTNLGVAASGANADITSLTGLTAISPTSALAIGSATQALTLQGNASSVLTATSGANTTTVGFTSPVANTVLNLPALSAGTYTVCTSSGNCAGAGGGVTSTGGTTGKIAKFSGANTIVDSLLSESGTIVAIAGNGVIQGAAGSASLTVGVAGANTGSIVLAHSSNSHTLTLQSPSLSSDLTFVLPAADAANGSCLTTNGSGTLSFSACTGGAGGGVTSLNGLTGVLTLANATTGGSTIAINDATTAAKGIASFSSANFTVTSGVVNTIQNLHTTASPTFTAVNTNTLTPTGALTLGATAIPFTMQGSSASVITATSGANVTTLSFTVPTGINSITIPNASGVLCLQGSVSCGFALSGGGGSIQNGTTLQTSANFSIQSATTTDPTARIQLLASQTSNAFEVRNSAGSATLSGIDAYGNLFVNAGQSLKIAGSTGFPASPSEGQMYFRTDTKQLYVYENGKWQGDRTTATKTVAMGTATGCSGSVPVASQNPESADFVSTSCTASQTTINAAIAALPSSGGTIYLLDGTYIIDGSILLPNNVTLIGQDAATVVKSKNSMATSIDMVTNSNQSTGNVNMRVSNMALDGNFTNNGSLYPRAIYMVNTGAANTPGLTLSGVTIRDSYTGMAFDTTYSNRIINNTVIKPSGIGNSSMLDWGDGTSKSYIANNYFSASYSAIYISGDDNVVVGNVVADCGYANACVANYGERNAIRDNSITLAGGYGALDMVGMYGVASGNRITSTAGYNGTSGAAIEVRGSWSVVTDNTISDKTSMGIWVNGANYALIKGNIMRNLGGTGSDSAIYVYNSSLGTSYATISENIITDYQGTGYAIELASNAKHTTLSGNIYNGTGASSILDNGIGTIYNGQSLPNKGVAVSGAAGVVINGTSSGSYSLQNSGSFVQGGIATPSSPTLSIVGATGSTTWGYRVSAYDGKGETLASSEVQVANGFATLDGTHYVRVFIHTIPGAVSYRVYRTTASGTPSSTGYIGSISVTAADVSFGDLAFSDTGLLASGSVPAVNTTGQFTASGASVLFKNSSNTSTAFQVQNTSSISLLRVDTTGANIVLGTPSAQAATLQFANATNANLVGITAQSGTAAYTLQLPMAVASDQCLKSGTVSGSDVPLVFGSCGGAAEPGPAELWESRTTAIHNQWYDVAYGDGIFVAISDSGTGNRVMTSPDGINWTSRTSAADNSWSSITYGNGLFVAVATSGTGDRVMTSPDGISWTIRASAANNDWRSVAYGNGRFVAVASTGSSNRVMTSPDGINWMTRTNPIDNDWRSVTFGNGLFVAVSSSGTGNRVMTSTDGVVWTMQSSAADNYWRDVAYGNGVFVAVAATGMGNHVMTSTDGVVWNSHAASVDNDWLAITYGNGVFAAVSYTGSGNRVMTSTDGSSWTSRSSAANNSWNGIAYGNGIFVAVSYDGVANRVMTSGIMTENISTDRHTYQGGVTIASPNGSNTLLDLQSNASSIYAVSSAGDLTFGNNADHVVAVAQRSGTNAGRNLTIQGGSGSGTDQNGGSLVLQGGNSTGSGLAGAVVVKPQADTSAAFQVQKAGGSAIMTVDSVGATVKIGTTGTPTLSGATLLVTTAEFTSTLRIGDATNKAEYDSTTHELTFSGNARHSRSIILTAEYAGAVLDAGSGSNNQGTMTSSLDLTNRKNYYQWVTSQATSQSYDIVVQVPIPSDFSAWSSSTPLTLDTYSSNTSSGTIELEMRDTAGNVEAGNNFRSMTPSVNSTWQAVSSGAVVGTYATDGVMTIRIRVYATSAVTAVRVGSIKLSYLSKW